MSEVLGLFNKYLFKFHVPWFTTTLIYKKKQTKITHGAHEQKIKRPMNKKLRYIHKAHKWVIEAVMQAKDQKPIAVMITYKNMGSRSI